MIEIFRKMIYNYLQSERKVDDNWYVEEVNVTDSLPHTTITFIATAGSYLAYGHISSENGTLKVNIYIGDIQVTARVDC